MRTQSFEESVAMLLVGVFTIVGSVTFTLWLAAIVRAQPAERAKSYQWKVTDLIYNDNTAGRIDVIDTGGVCLYVFVRSGQGSAITAVPKTQLPVGAGCQ